MINPKYKFTRIKDEPFTKERLLGEVSERIKGLFKEGTIIDDGLGQGFNVRFGKPTTLKDFLFPSSSFTPIANEAHKNKIRNLIG